MVEEVGNTLIKLLYYYGIWALKTVGPILKIVGSVSNLIYFLIKERVY